MALLGIIESNKYAMKKIQTKLFRIGGIWQLGFMNLWKSDIERLKSLRGFRYNPVMKMWHMASHVNTLQFLNNKYEGIFEFLADPRPRSEAPDISENSMQPTAWVSIEPEADRMVLRHDFNKQLYYTLGQLEGSFYDRTNRNWVLSIENHSVSIMKALAELNFTIIERTGGIHSNLQTPKSETTEAARSKAQLVEQFERDLFLRNRGERTIKSYKHSIERFLDHFRGRDLQDVTNEEIRNYLHDLTREKGYSFSTLNIHISAIKTFYAYEFSLDIQQINIPRPAKSRHLPKVISKEEIQRMISVCRNLKHRTIIIMLYSTAMRREELLNLTLGDIHTDNRQLRILGKGNKERYIYLSDKLVEQLDQYMKMYAPVQYLFEGTGGAKYSGSSIANIIRTAARRAGIDRQITPHMLRHSFATHMLTSGVSPMHIQKILGHTNIKTTLVYTHLTDKDLSNLPNPLDNIDF